jgi:hypothetical protein
MNTQVKYFHVRNPYGNGGLTVAYKEELNSVQYGVAYCSEKDQFNRSLGRANAVDRLENIDVVFSNKHQNNFKRNGCVTIGTEFKNYQHIKYHVLLDILFSELTTKRLVKSIIADELLVMANRYID